MATIAGKTCLKTRASLVSITKDLPKPEGIGSHAGGNKGTQQGEGAEDNVEIDLLVITARNLLLGTICLLFSLASCSDGEVYYRFQHIEKAQWQRDNVLVFAMDSALFQPNKEYYFSLELTTNRGYPYRDLWLRVDHNLQDTLFHTDTIHAILADEQGTWLGSGVGGLNQLSFPYLGPLVPTVRDSITGYRLMIEQVMHDNPLRGVEKIGLKVIEARGEK